MDNKKFFNKDLPKKCGYCKEARPVSGGKEFFCLKRGITSYDDSCRSYKYDPLKRQPAPKGIGRDFDPADLKIL